MKTAVAQMRMSASMEENLRKSIGALEEAKKQGADIVLYPEIQLSPFFPQYEKRDASKYLINYDSYYFKTFCRACRENKIMAAPNFYFQENGRNYDVSFLIDEDGSVIGKQKMVHIAQAEGFYEQDYYAPSEEGFNIFETPFGNIAIVVCFDRHYPESIRTAVLKGADLVLIPTANTIGEPSEIFEWEIRIQSFQNSVPIVMCNRVGTEGEVTFSGESICTDANGTVINKLGREETVATFDIDISMTKKIRNAKPYTMLRRPELYV